MTTTELFDDVADEFLEPRAFRQATDDPHRRAIALGSQAGSGGVSVRRLGIVDIADAASAGHQLDAVGARVEGT